MIRVVLLVLVSVFASAQLPFMGMSQRPVSGGGGGGGTQENLYCAVGDVCNFGPADGPAATPTAGIYTGLNGTPSPGTVRTVNSSNCNDATTGLQAQLNNAVAGDVIVIPATLTCSGAYTTPALAGNITHWTWIRTDQINNPAFPPEGTRATPCEINITHIDSYPDYPCSTPGVRMPTISSNATNTPPLTIQGSFWRVTGLSLTKPVGLSMLNALVSQPGANHVILDRVLIHGVDYSSATKFDTKAGVVTNGTYQAIINSWIYDVDYNSADGQCISGGGSLAATEGPYKFYNNLLACSSESWIFGGGAAVAVPDNFEIRYNLSMKPLKWMFPQGATSFNISVNVKNLGEWKQGNHVLMENNVFTFLWEGQADQYGSPVLNLPKSQSAQNINKFANTSGTAITCASDASGTPCAAHTGIWGNRISTLSRTGGIVTLVGLTDGGWPYYNAGANIILQGIPSQVVSGTDMASLNGEWTMGCLNATTCTSGYNTPTIIYFAAPGPDFPTTTVLGGLAHDFTSQTCGIPGHCVFDAPRANYPQNPIISVTDSEHITVQNPYPVQTGATQVTCHSGLTPNATQHEFIGRYNYLSHAENIGFTVGNLISQCQDIGKGAWDYTFHDNLADDIDTTAWNRGNGSCCGHGGQGPELANSIATPALFPHDVLYAHNTWAGLRAWPAPITPFSGEGFGWVDPYNVTYPASTVQRISNVVTITFPTKNGASQSNTGIVAGFINGGTAGNFADINGTWPLQLATSTQITFTETGSNADINPAVTITSGATGAATVKYPLTYYKNITWRDNIFPSPLLAADYGGNLVSGGLSGGLALNMCSGGTCTWQIKNNIMCTACWSGYPQGTGAPLPTVNPDASSTCTVTGGCTVADLSGVFVTWGNGEGNTSGNNYTVTANYHNAASDGKDIGADMSKLGPLIASVPHFTWYPLTISTASLTACTNGTYCEQQLLTSSSASTPTANGFVRWTLVTGPLPTGMNLANGEGYATCQVNGAYSKTGPTGCQGWLWGTPTTPGSYPMTFQVEDAAHQKATVNLTLTVN